MKHAYLIITHNEWEVLQRLVSMLDDTQNEIFIHFDKKVKSRPKISTAKSSLHILDKTIDVRWGAVSQIECELCLFEEAMKHGPFDFYILISGVHLPLKSNEYISEWLSRYKQKSIFSNLEISDNGYQETLKLHRYNLFLRNYQSPNKVLQYCSQFFWKSFIWIQKKLNISTNNNCQFYWANNWAVFSGEAIDFMLANKKTILKKYRWSFCGDEYFAPSELMDSPLKDKIINDDCLLYCDIGRANAATLSVETDYPKLCKTDYIFARKFSREK